MTKLTDEQRNVALELLQEYRNSPKEEDGLNSEERSLQRDNERIQVIEEILKPLLKSYFDGDVELLEFKSKVDSISKRHKLWGFKGIKGQMFFNMIVKTADDISECDQELKSALEVPENEQIASSRIKTFAGYIKRLGDQWIDEGNDRRGTPKLSSILFFLSYFWQIQDRDKWPVFYTNSFQTMSDLNLWQSCNELHKDYLAFKHIHEELIDIYTKETGDKYNLYMVEHVFWYKGGDPYKLAASNKNDVKVKSKTRKPLSEEASLRLPDSYLPPIIEILPRIALHDQKLTAAAKKSGTSIERAFEKFIHAAFTMLGYETKLLGQGQGRVPDGTAHAIEDSYIIIWDAKIRTSGYSMGTDDRTIREYVGSQSNELRRKARVKNLYYMIISSTFTDDFDDTIRSIKMETNVNEVILVEADAIVAMVDAKLRDPIITSLGVDGLQRLFTSSGILEAEYVREQLM